METLKERLKIKEEIESELKKVGVTKNKDKYKEIKGRSKEVTYEDKELLILKR